MELIGCSHKPHDTSHTCISMMTEKEVSPTLIKKTVGHSSAMSLTENGYTHVNAQELFDAINKMRKTAKVEITLAVFSYVAVRL